jgi:GNAT superfamily N-acetyltransferase
VLIESRPALDPELAALAVAPFGGLDDDCLHLVAVVGGRAVGYGAWRPAPEPGAAEITQMFVRPAFRGRGIARQLIVAVEEEALAAGWALIRLETGSQSAAAVALCQSSGYHQLAAYGGRLLFEKRLAALVQ